MPMLADMVSCGRAALCTSKGAVERIEQSVGGGFGIAGAGAVDQHHELVTPEATDRVGFAQRALKPDGHLA